MFSFSIFKSQTACAGGDDSTLCWSIKNGRVRHFTVCHILTLSVFTVDAGRRPARARSAVPGRRCRRRQRQPINNNSFRCNAHRIFVCSAFSHALTYRAVSARVSSIYNTDGRCEVPYVLSKAWNAAGGSPRMSAGATSNNSDERIGWTAQTQNRKTVGNDKMWFCIKLRDGWQRCISLVVQFVQRCSRLTVHVIRGSCKVTALYHFGLLLWTPLLRHTGRQTERQTV